MAAALAFLSPRAAIAFDIEHLDVFTVLLSLWVLIGALVRSLDPTTPWLAVQLRRVAIWVTGLATTKGVETFDGPAWPSCRGMAHHYRSPGFVLHGGACCRSDQSVPSFIGGGCRRLRCGSGGGVSRTSRRPSTAK